MPLAVPPPSALPGVAFVVPVYNKAPYLPAVLAAIRAQEGDFVREHIFVDDGSTDGSLELVRALTRDWPNVTIIEQSNHGSAHATNRGIERTRLPYIKFVDADDLIPRRATLILLEALEAHPDAVLAFGDRALFDDPAEVDLRGPAGPGRIERIEEPLRATIKGSLFNPTQILARTEACKRVGGCDERLRFAQDYTLGLRLASEGTFLCLDAVVAWWPREAPGRVSTLENRQLQRINQALAHHVRDHPQLPLTLKRYACRRAAGRAWHFARRQFGAGYGSAWFRRYLRCRLPYGPSDASFIDACTRVFEDAEVTRDRLRLGRPATPRPIGR